MKWLEEKPQIISKRCSNKAPNLSNVHAILTSVSHQYSLRVSRHWDSNRYIWQKKKSLVVRNSARNTESLPPNTLGRTTTPTSAPLMGFRARLELG